MRSRGIMKAAMVVALVAIAVFALGGVALAGPGGQAGPATPTLGDPVGSDVSPHGGYSSSTSFCIQCHEVHQGGDYALLVQASVTGVCQTCHALFGSTAGTVRNPNQMFGTSLTIGTAALRTAYDEASSGAAVAEHNVTGSAKTSPDGVMMMESAWAYGAFAPRGLGNSCTPNNSTNPNWAGAAYCGPPSTTQAGPGTASATTGGLYCGSCHTEHGDFGQLINALYYRTTAGGNTLNTVQKFQNNGPIAVGMATQYLWQAAPGAVWQKCTAQNGGGTCTNLTATDSLGETGIYLYGYKLLTAYPNANYGSPESWGLDSFSHDQARWCGTCHPKHVSALFGGIYNNHPTGCTACHGIPNTAQNPTLTASFDFPHTSTVADFLRNYPDGLCVGCHTQGSLP